MGRRFPWVWVESVPWAAGAVLTRGTVDGLPLLTWGRAPREKLATRRQLRKLDLRPGGADPVAVLYVRHRASGRCNFANLYLIDRAKPVRPMTPAKWRALALANRARRICRSCGKDSLYVLPTSTRLCWLCFEAETAESGTADDYPEAA